MMQQILLSYGVGIARGDYWSLEFRADAYDSSTSGAANGARVDSSGNVHLPFYFDDSSGNSTRLAGLLKTDYQGVLQWARGYTSTSTAVTNYGCDVSSSGNIFHHSRQGNTYVEHQLLGSDGQTVQWARSLGADPNDNLYNNIANRIGASGGHYITGQDVDNIVAKPKLALFKLNSTGGISWARALHGPSDQNYITPGIQFGIDSSENTYHTVNHYEHPFGTGTGYKKSSDIAKYNSSGSIQWKKEYKIGGSATDWDLIDLKGIACDSSGNSYAFGRYVQASLFSGSKGIIIGSNSSGTVQWFRSIPKDSSGYGGELIRSGAVDSSGNFYTTTTGRHNNDRTSVVVHKFNSSGAVVWSYKLYYNASASNIDWGYCSIDSNDNLYVSGYATVSGVARVVLIKVPSDGTGQDDYGNLTWAATTTTVISSVTSYSTGTSPLTDASLSQVTATITIPQTSVSPALNSTKYPD